MNHWLFKSEPTVFSIDHLRNRAKQTAPWDGVRNYQVRNLLRDVIKPGDLAFFYHSSCTPPGITGIMKVVKAGYPDSTSWDSTSDHFDPKSSPDHPIWYMVDVQFVEKFSQMITLDEIKQQPKLQTMVIARKGNRLSITPVTKEEWDTILKLKR